MRIIFLEKLYTKGGREASPRPKVNWAHLKINSSKCYKGFFICSSGGLPKYITTTVLNTSTAYNETKEIKQFLEILTPRRAQWNMK